MARSLLDSFAIKPPDLSEYLSDDSRRMLELSRELASFRAEPMGELPINRLVEVIERQAEEFHLYAQNADRSAQNAYHLSIASLVVATLSLAVAVVSLVLPYFV